jgi:lipoate---protein ligase
MIVSVQRGGAAAFHERAVTELGELTLWWFEVDRPAIVLGSSQPIGHLDVDACAQRGVEVVRRRSGGGAVLLEPDDVVWVDVLLPPSDPRWTDDVGESALWLGRAWQSALAELGVGATSVHSGAMLRAEWSSRVCFAGRGAGEVMRGDAKVVGISQRRSRAAARFQCALYRHWRPHHHSPLFATPAPPAADLAGLALEIRAADAEIRAALEAALTT